MRPSSFWLTSLACAAAVAGCGEDPQLCARVLFVDPPVAWNGADTEVAVYAVDVVAPVQVVSIAPAGSTNETRLVFEPAEGHPDRPNAVVPKGTAPGVYDVILRDAGTGCTEKVDGGLTISDDASLTLTAVEPSVGFGPEVNELTISASGAGFGTLPAVYLTSDALAKPVRLGAVASLSATSLVAETPAGLAAGTYSIVVVNQDGTAGVLDDGFAVTVTAPPSVTSIAPMQVPANTGNASITITGANFRTPSVKYRCHGPSGTAFPDQPATVSNATASTITATINTTSHTAGANCNIVVTNGDNARTEFTSLVVVTPQQNLTNFTAGPELTGPRQFMGSVSGTAGKTQFVYAIAGDNGTSALKSVEFVALDRSGRPVGGFIKQRNQLNNERTDLGVARIGRFIYAVGGTEVVGDGQRSLASVERAAILDPDVVPKQLTTDLVLTRDNKGLEGGSYYYRVAAIMSGDDPFNPNGESLASSRIGVQFPSMDRRVQVELSWMPVPNAVRYRIYRTLADGAAGSEALIADTNDLPDTVTCSGPTTCTDLGAIPDEEANPPLPLGSTGRWETLDDDLNNERRGVGVAAGFDPNDPSKAYLYAIGGMNASQVALGTYEFYTITIGPDGSQTYSPPATGTAELGNARWRVGAYAVTRADSARVDGTYIWTGSGESSGGTPVSVFDGARVQPGGQLGPFATSAHPQAFSGYGAFAAGNFLYVLGGANGQPATSNTNVELSASCSPCTLNSFQSFSPGMNTARVGLGSASQSGYFYILGGGSPGGVLTSTEFVLY